MSMDFRVIENYSAHLVAGEEVEIIEYPQCESCNDATPFLSDGLCQNCTAESRKQRIRDICEKGYFPISAVAEGE